MVRKYLKIKIEKKNMLVDLSILSTKEITFSIGEAKGDKFIPSKEINLDELEVILNGR